MMAPATLKEYASLREAYEKYQIFSPLLKEEFKSLQLAYPFFEAEYLKTLTHETVEESRIEEKKPEEIDGKFVRDVVVIEDAMSVEKQRLDAEREMRKARRAEKMRLKAEREAAAQLRNRQRRLERRARHEARQATMPIPSKTWVDYQWRDWLRLCLILLAALAVVMGGLWLIVANWKNIMDVIAPPLLAIVAIIILIRNWQIIFISLMSK